MDHYEYKREELEVGMEVYVPYYVTYGWQTRFRYPIWGTEKIKKLTPKKTKITLENGRVIELKKNCDGHHTKLYRYDSEMPRETSVGKAFQMILRDSREVSNIRFPDLGDEEMIEVASKMRDILELVNKGNKNDKSE